MQRMEASGDISQPIHEGVSMEPCMNCRAGVGNDVKGSHRQREAVRLYDEEGLSYEQVGIRLGGISRQRATQLVEKGRRNG